MSKAYIFPGQASQFVGMGKPYFDNLPTQQKRIKEADEILGYPLSKIMFEGPEDELKQTRNTQPAVFLHSILVYNANAEKDQPAAVAGHSLGEISALVAAGVVDFETGLKLVQTRADAMQIACDKEAGTMAAILGMEDDAVVEICQNIDEVVIAANFNCPGQLVISGSAAGIEAAITKCNEAGARRAIPLVVGGAFHSPLMQPAVDIFAEAVNKVEFNDSQFPVYQNVHASPETNAAAIKQNLIDQITSPVRWTQSIQNMIVDGITDFIEVGGKGKILMGMVRKISRDVNMVAWTEQV